jgi:YkoY family integral membrane protein
MDQVYFLWDHTVNYFAHVPAQWQEFSTDLPKFLPIIGMLIIIESLLSVDNAAVLATMVVDLPKEQRNKALKYGIIGAYFFRGICLVLAAFLTSFWFLQPLGGAYLLWLVYSHFKSKDEQEEINKSGHWLYKTTIGWMGQFWATVALVEVMDLAFSIDNVFAAAAYTPNIIAIWIGVFIGILGMRFIATWFVKLMGKFPFLETAAFVVIGVLGLKLLLTAYPHVLEKLNTPKDSFSAVLASEYVEWGISAITLLIFIVPVITSIMFNYPKRAIVHYYKESEGYKEEKAPSSITL